MQEIVGTTADEFSAALEYAESEINVGEWLDISICTEALPTAAEIQVAGAELLLSGVTVRNLQARVIDGIPTTTFQLQKTQQPAGTTGQWQLIIPLVIPGLVIGLITFGIFKIGDVTASLTNFLVPLILITGGVVVAVAALLRKPAETVAVKYIESGKPSPKLLPRAYQYSADTVALPKKELAYAWGLQAATFSTNKKPTRNDIEIAVYNEDLLGMSVRVIDRRDGHTVKDFDVVEIMTLSGNGILGAGLQDIKSGTHHEYGNKTRQRHWAKFIEGLIGHMERQGLLSNEHNDEGGGGDGGGGPKVPTTPAATPTTKRTPAEDKALLEKLWQESHELERKKAALQEKAGILLPDTDRETIKMYCQNCGKEVFPNSFRPGEYMRAFFITGMCQECQDKYEQLVRKTKELWVKMCQHDNVPPESKFVVFSDDNPYAKEYNEAMGELQQILAKVRVPGFMAPPKKKLPPGIEKDLKDIFGPNLPSTLLAATGDGRRKTISYIQTADGKTMVEWWKRSDFFGRETIVESFGDKGSTREVIPIPDEVVLCDFCNDAITEFPVSVLWGTHALCKKCFAKVQDPKNWGSDDNLEPQAMDMIGDSPEFLAATIDDSGWREKLDQAFLSAVARVKAQG